MKYGIKSARLLKKGFDSDSIYNKKLFKNFDKIL